MFNGTKVIETERLILSPFKAGDEDNMYYNYANDARVTEFLTWKPHPNVDVTRAYLNSFLDNYSCDTFYRWAIELKETNEVIGVIDVVDTKADKFKVTLGYVLGYNFWGKGYMPEAGKQVIDYLFNEGFYRIEAWHHVKNPKSGRVMQKIGMTHEGTLKNYDVDNNGVLQDMEMYAIVKNN